MQSGTSSEEVQRKNNFTTRVEVMEVPRFGKRIVWIKGVQVSLFQSKKKSNGRING